MSQICEERLSRVLSNQQRVPTLTSRIHGYKRTGHPTICHYKLEKFWHSSIPKIAKTCLFSTIFWLQLRTSGNRKCLETNLINKKYKIVTILFINIKLSISRVFSKCLGEWVLHKFLLKLLSIFSCSFGSIPRESLVKVQAPVPVVHGDWMSLPIAVRDWTKKQIELCQPDRLHIMDGGIAEDKSLKVLLSLICQSFWFHEFFLILEGPIGQERNPNTIA